MEVIKVITFLMYSFILLSSITIAVLCVLPKKITGFSLTFEHIRSVSYGSVLLMLLLFLTTLELSHLSTQSYAIVGLFVQVVCLVGQIVKAIFLTKNSLQ